MTTDLEAYPMLNPDPEMQEILLENLGGEIEASLLPRMRVPRGDMTAYEIKTLEGTKYEPSFEAVILGTIRTQAYWPKEFGQDGSVDEPPLCAASRAGDSNAIMVGHVDRERAHEMPSEWLELRENPDFSCLNCPLNQYGSHPSGDNRKACNAGITLILLRPGHALPTIMQIPATSIKNFKAYGMNLTQQASRTSAVVTRIGCTTAESSSGIKYAQVTFEVVRPLEVEAAERAEQLRKPGGIARNVITALARTDNVGELTTGNTTKPADKVVEVDDLSLDSIKKATK